jgi:peptide/nickel transport system substrate-binding protein
MTDYWAKLVAHRVTRRRAVATAGGFAAGAALLAACGGGNKSSSKESAPSLVYVPKEATNVTKGGTFTSTAGDVQSFTTVGPLGAPDSVAAAHGYSRLVKQKVYKYPEEALPTAAPDAATSWEASPDGLTYTFKLRPNFKFDPRPPTSGRAMTSADVKYSWQVFVKTNAFRTYLAQETNPDAPVTSFETPDANTVVFKMAYPSAPFLPYLTWNRILTVMPVEADGKFDAKMDMRGSGAWRLKEYKPSSLQSYEPNPDWYDAAKMNFSGMTFYNVPEYAARLSQFTAGNLADMGGTGVLQQDILSTKRDHPELLLKPIDRLKLYQEFIRFSYLPNQPFFDERVRRAASMLIDRDLLIETVNETKLFTDAGFKVEKRWATSVAVGEPWWLDPKGKDFGPEAAVFKFDPAEAKKMLRAAGYNSAIKTQFVIAANSPTDLEREATILANMIAAGGDFEIAFKKAELASDWRPNYHFNGDKHEGMAYGFFRNTFPDVDIPMFFFMKSGDPQAGHLAADGKPDTVLDGLYKKQRGETDFNKRMEVMKEIQRYMAKHMYTLSSAGDATRFELAQPWLGNWGVYRTYSPDGGPSNELYPYLFIDSARKK